MTSKGETKLVNKMRMVGRTDYGSRLVAWKNHGSMYSKAGVSDLTGGLDGVMWACEVKDPLGPTHKRATLEASIEHALVHGPTVLQRAFVADVLAAGGCAGFAATVAQFNEILDHAAQRADNWHREPYCPGHNILPPPEKHSGSDADEMFPETE